MKIFIYTWMVVAFLIWCGLNDVNLPTLLWVIIGFIIFAFALAAFMVGRGYSEMVIFSERMRNAAKMIYDTYKTVPKYEEFCNMRDQLKNQMNFEGVISDFHKQEKHPIMVGDPKKADEARAEVFRILNGIDTRDGRIYFFGKTRDYRKSIERVLKNQWNPEDPGRYIAVADEICELLSKNSELMKKMLNDLNYKE